MVGGAKPVAVGGALVAEHEAHGAGCLGGPGPEGVCGSRPPDAQLLKPAVGRPQRASVGLRWECRLRGGGLTPLQVPQGQGGFQQGEDGPGVGLAFYAVRQSLHLPHRA